MKHLGNFGVALFLGLSCIVSATAGSIQNGSFETFNSGYTLPSNGICESSNVYGAYPLCSLANWQGTYQVGKGSTGFSIPQPDPDGVQALILQSYGNITPQAYQSVNLNGGNYTLSYYAANRPDYGGQQTVRVLLDGSQIGSYAPTGAWRQQIIEFTAAAGLHQITFAGVAGGSDSSAFIDNVVLTGDASAVPEPASLGFAGGFAAFALALLRRRRS